MNPESRSGESAQGKSCLADELCKVISKTQSLYMKQRFAKGVQRNITDFFKAWITTDSIKIFSITFCTLVTVYCTCKIAKGAFRIVLYVTTFCMQHCAVACFVLKQRCSTNRCQRQKGGLTCTKLCACSDDDEPREKALQEDDGDEYVDDNDESDKSYDNVSDSDEDN